MTVVAGIRIYPVKSCRGIDAETAVVERRGLAHDRRHMLIDANDRFVTQRQHPQMALIGVTQDATGLTLTAPGAEPLRIAATQRFDACARVTIWRGGADAAIAPDDVNQWLTRHLGFDCRLVRMDAEHHRAVAHESAQSGDEVSFADGAPLLLASLASLRELNARLAKPVSITQFRPNLIIDDSAAFAEDAWQRIRIGGAELEVAWPCARCIMITIDPETGRADGDGEPLRTLRTFRQVGRGVMFGQNVIPRRLGPIAVGDRVEIVSLREREQ